MKFGFDVTFHMERAEQMNRFGKDALKCFKEGLFPSVQNILHNSNLTPRRVEAKNRYVE